MNMDEHIRFTPSVLTHNHDSSAQRPCDHLMPHKWRVFHNNDTYTTSQAARPEIYAATLLWPMVLNTSGCLEPHERNVRWTSFNKSFFSHRSLPDLCENESIFNTLPLPKTFPPHKKMSSLAVCMPSNSQLVHETPDHFPEIGQESAEMVHNLRTWMDKRGRGCTFFLPHLVWNIFSSTAKYKEENCPLLHNKVDQKKSPAERNLRQLHTRTINNTHHIFLQ